MVQRVLVEKKPGFDIEARGVFHDLVHNLGMTGLTAVRIVHQYDVEGIDARELETIKTSIFSEPPVDAVDTDIRPKKESDRIFAVEYLPGQYDQRADSAAQAIQLVTHKDAPLVRTAKRYILEGLISDAEFETITGYIVNPVESRLADLTMPESLVQEYPEPPMVSFLDGFIDADDAHIENMASELGLAMSPEDLLFCREYFKSTEKRNPSITEIRMIDTYWSDHCRHTTFLSGIDSVSFCDGPYKEAVMHAYKNYLDVRNDLYKGKDKPVTLMDLAVIGAKALKAAGKLDDLDESEEINACSIKIEVEIDGKKEPWLLMFKNETHNHPTEIEPFGGAATCLGGAIRDPLSGRSYVYQAMRVTGAADPRTPVSETIPGKLPQRKICTVAAHGYSSYGNQIGLATGEVAELYHPGYAAKRMEIGAVVGAAPAENVRRERPAPGDLIILLGGRTGRDGIGGATGSSKAHTEESLESCGAEVQKGNPPTERKIQRLFRNKTATTLIKRCNDFGAGGVSVAIGELADGLCIELDKVPKKYAGLDGTELAISESQERMAVVVSENDSAAFIKLAAQENLEAVIVAKVTESSRLVMKWRDKIIVDLSRSFLDTNGVTQHVDVEVKLDSIDHSVQSGRSGLSETQTVLSSLSRGSRKGLVERFDSTIGAGTVLMPFGGLYQRTPAAGMAALIPVLEGKTSTTSLMSWGFDPILSEKNPFIGASFAVISSLAKIVAMGGDYRKARLTFQEYFEKLTDKQKWGKPFSALLGAFEAQMAFGTASIGGKDSMSGTFMDMHVPPTLVSFAVCTSDASLVCSSELKEKDTAVMLWPLPVTKQLIPDYDGIRKVFDTVSGGITEGKILSAAVIDNMCTGSAEVQAKICEMAFGNMIGLDFSAAKEYSDTVMPGSLCIELAKSDVAEYRIMGAILSANTMDTSEVRFTDGTVSLEKLYSSWSGVLEDVYPLNADNAAKQSDNLSIVSCAVDTKNISAKTKVSTKPRVVIPVFPGTNCEYDTARAFEEAGASVQTIVIRNLNPIDIEESINALAAGISNSQIVMIPGGFSAGDEPEGSGKFIASFFRNPRVADAVTDLLDNRDGLMLGICNGFQALIKLGLLPSGRIDDLSPVSPSLTFNTIGRHVSTLVHTKVVNNTSPWLSLCNTGDIHTVPVSHGEGRFVADSPHIDELVSNGQIAFQYTDPTGNPSMEIPWNPNGSVMAIEGITSPDGRVMGKMGHSERKGPYLYKNVPGNKDQKIFQAGVEYFTK